MRDIRFWLVAPVAALVLALFGLYHAGLRRVRDTWAVYPWALTCGICMGLGNIFWNVVFATFIFLRPPVWHNESGEFSPFFTTRLKSYRAEGYDPLVEYLIGAIRQFDPDHF